MGMFSICEIGPRHAVRSCTIFWFSVKAGLPALPAVPSPIQWRVEPQGSCGPLSALALRLGRSSLSRT